MCMCASLVMGEEDEELQSWGWTDLCVSATHVSVCRSECEIRLQGFVVVRPRLISARTQSLIRTAGGVFFKNTVIRFSD